MTEGEERQDVGLTVVTEKQHPEQQGLWLPESGGKANSCYRSSELEKTRKSDGLQR